MPFSTAQTSLLIPVGKARILHPNGLIGHGWTLENGKRRTMNGDCRKMGGPVTTSMPNLLDSERKRILPGDRHNGLILTNGPLRLIEDVHLEHSVGNGGLKNGFRNGYGKQPLLTDLTKKSETSTPLREYNLAPENGGTA